MFERSLKINTKFKKTHLEFYEKVEKIKIYRKILLPFTQVIFDFVESFRMLSGYLRKRSNLYNKFMNTIKQSNLLHQRTTS